MRLRHTPSLCFLAVASFVAAASAQTARPSDGIERVLSAITPEFIKAHVTFLGDDLLEGRRPGTAGYDIAARHVAATLQGLGLEPGAGQSFFQRVPLLETKAVVAATELTLDNGGRQETLVFGRDFVTRGNAFEPSVELSAPLVFVGYGVVAPEHGHDDYATLDVKGKIVVALFGAPKRFPPTARAHYASGLVKAQVAVSRGAAGVLSLVSPAYEKLYAWDQLAADVRRGSVTWVDARGQPANEFRELGLTGAIHQVAAEKLFAGTSTSAVGVFARDAAGEPLPGMPLRTTLSARIASVHRRFESENVAAIYRGAALRDEFVVYTAHLDHLGVGDPINGDSIYNGVLDNASGVAGMLAVAKAFSALPERPLRSVLFLAVTAEEMGLIGSDYFARNPTVPAGAIVANVNIDGLSLLYDFRDLVALGTEHSTLSEPVSRAARRLGLEITPDPFPEQLFFIRSDQYSFVRQGIPAVFVSEGIKAVDATLDVKALFERWIATRYHRPSDDLGQPLDFNVGAKGARFQFLLGYFVASDRDRPRWRPGDFFGERFGRKK